MYGIVIGKVEIRTFEGSMFIHKNIYIFYSLFIQGDRQQRSVLNLTFRDSIKDFVNIAYWLSPKDLIIISSKFTTGDVGMN
jgi:hypothetical protein